MIYKEGSESTYKGMINSTWSESWEGWWCKLNLIEELKDELGFDRGNQWNRKYSLNKCESKATVNMQVNMQVPSVSMVLQASCWK